MATEVIAVERRVMERISALLVAASIGPDEVACRIETDGSVRRVHLDFPGPVDRGLEHALAVRVLDAMRSSGGPTYGTVDVLVHPGTARDRAAS
jgi:hypothetical protein